MAHTERRQDERMPLRLTVREHVAGLAQPALAVELSAAGATVLSGAHGRSLQSEVALELSLPGTGERIWTVAETRWMGTRDGHRSAGIRFLDMEPAHKRLLHDYLGDLRLRALEPRPPRRWMQRLRSRVLSLLRARVRRRGLPAVRV